ncbi:MAG: hypothetical protein EXR62_15940 [Chloroflexi bacterium]|nr:hypothetical protein [Chloroflexota bacterium]
MTTQFTQFNPKVGFIGLGAMGMPMAQALVRAGLVVKGYDVRQEAGAAFARDGGIGVASAVAAAEGADVLLVIVVNAEQAADILFGKTLLANPVFRR